MMREYGTPFWFEFIIFLTFLIPLLVFMIYGLGYDPDTFTSILLGWVVSDLTRPVAATLWSWS